MTTELSTPPEVTDIQIQRENAAFEMLQRQAKMFSSSSLVPKDFQGNVANCAIGINIAKRLGADPFMVLQNIDIIHGRPSFRATFLIAMVNAAGRFEPLQFRMEGDEGKPSRSCVAFTKSKPDGTPLEGPKITLEMAKAEGWSTKNGSKWLTMPELMLRYRAAAFFARLYAPDITLGMMTAEEAVDIQQERDVTPAIIPASKLLFEVKQEPKAIDPNRTSHQKLADSIDANGMTWGEVANAATEGGLFLDAEAELASQPEDVVLEIMSVWPQLVASVKGGAR
jgi:hypothetical protein